MSLFIINKDYTLALTTSALFSMKRLYAKFSPSTKSGEHPFAPRVSVVASVPAKRKTGETNR